MNRYKTMLADGLIIVAIGSLGIALIKASGLYGELIAYFFGAL